jgi:hypothetical protein
VDVPEDPGPKIRAFDVKMEIAVGIGNGALKHVPHVAGVVK